jgi:hypothetical protein
MVDEEEVNRFLVTVKGTPIGLYHTDKIASAVAKECDGTVYYIDAIENCRAHLAFFARYEDRKKFNDEVN